MPDNHHALGIDHKGLAEPIAPDGLGDRVHRRGGNAARVARIGRHGVEWPLFNPHAKYFRARSSRAPSSPAPTTRARLAAVAPSSASIHSVADRTREIGLRRALGARTGVVLWVVSRQTMTLMFLGARVGLVLSLATSRLIAPLLFGVSPTDAEALLSFTVLLLLTSALASFLAAYRATRIDPMVALQTE